MTRRPSGRRSRQDAPITVLVVVVAVGLVVMVVNWLLAHW